MTLMSRSNAVASIFISLSLCGPARAGDPQGVQRGLTDFGGLMGGSVETPADAPAAVELQQAPAEALDAVAAWLLSEGKEKTLAADIARALGYSDPVSIKQKGYQSDDGMKHFAMINTQKTNELILVYQTAASVGYVWRTDRAGKLLVTVKTGGGSATQVDNSAAAADFEAQKSYFIAKVPPAK